MINFTKESLSKVTKHLDYETTKLLFDKYNINTVNRVAGFMAQCYHESGGFLYREENLNYSKNALLKVFPKYFKTETEAIKYAREPEKIANRVYANRMGNGDEESGDGYKYRGRGYIQLTGKNNYVKFSESIGKSLDSTIKYLGTKDGALESALWYWTENNINKYCDNDDIDGMTIAVNGGTNGLVERKNLYNKFKLLFSV